MIDNINPIDNSTALQLCLERDRLLSDPEFARSPSMIKLLRFLVEYKLSGNSVPLKSYTIATDALGRDANFNAQTDSYPRVQMGRLRRMLDNFYLQKGGDNRLAIPPNKYEILLQPNIPSSVPQAELIGQAIDSRTPSGAASQSPESEKLSGPSRRTDARWHFKGASIATLAGAILVALLGIIAFVLSAGPTNTKISYPKIALDLPDSQFAVSAGRLSKSIGNQLVRGLSGFDGIRIYDVKSSQRHEADYIIRLRFSDPQNQQIELRLLENASGEILWSEELHTNDEGALKLQVDKAIVALAGPYGEITQSEMSKAKSSYAPGYPCLLQFDVYVRYREHEKLELVHKCLQESVEQFPQDAYLLSILAFTENMSLRTPAKSTGQDSGMILARKAESLDNNSATANFAISQSAFFENDCATGVAWGKKAMALNPLNSRISGYLGLYMIGCNMPEGEAYAAQALALDPNTDLTIAAAVALQMLKHGDAEQARLLSSRYIASSPRHEPALALTYILSSAMVKEKIEARRAWNLLAERYGLSGKSPPRDVLRRFISSQSLIDEVMTILDRSELFET